MPSDPTSPAPKAATTAAQAQEKLTSGRAADHRVTELTSHRTAAMDDRDDKFVAFRDLATRLRRLVPGAYGPDSTQYAKVGGTRKSERKPRTRKAKV